MEMLVPGLALGPGASTHLHRKSQAPGIKGNNLFSISMGEKNEQTTCILREFFLESNLQKNNDTLYRQEFSYQ